VPVKRYGGNYIFGSILCFVALSAFAWVLGWRWSDPGAPFLLGALYWVVLSLSAFHAFRADKRLAEKGLRRTPESQLWLVSVFGGGVGALVGMRRYRHKTKKLAFRLFVPLLALVQICALMYLAVVTFSGHA